MPSTAPTGPDSIGTAASFGCIRMFNRDIVDLFERVEVGTPVVVSPDGGSGFPRGRRPRRNPALLRHVGSPT